MRRLRRLIRLLDINDVPPVALVLLAATIVLALLGYFDWRRDRQLAANGQEIRAEVLDRKTRVVADCDSDGLCTYEELFELAYRFYHDDREYVAHRTVSESVYNRTESTIEVLFLPEKPRVSDVAANIAASPAWPVVSILALFIGFVGVGIVWWRG